MKGVIIFAIVFFTVLFSIVFWQISVRNQAIQLENTFKAQDQVIEEFYGKMFAIFKQMAGISEEYKESFKEVYIPLIEGRYSQGDGSLMKWIQESNPTFDASIYKNLMSAVEGQREGFFIEQKKMTDIVLQHDNLRTLFPSSAVVGNREPLVYVPILPVDAKRVLETREETEEDLNLFGR